MKFIPVIYDLLYSVDGLVAFENPSERLGSPPLPIIFLCRWSLIELAGAPVLSGLGIAPAESGIEALIILAGGTSLTTYIS